MQVARVVLVHVILIDGVLGVIVDVLIGHDKVLVIYVAIFVVIFCIWRCTLYTKQYQKCNVLNVFSIGIKDLSTAPADSSWLKSNPEESLIN